MAFVKSNKIKVFPAAGRSSDYPTGYLTTEDNLNRVIKALYKNYGSNSESSFVINETTPTNLSTTPLSFIIQGYYFEIDELPSGITLNGNLYAAIYLRTTLPENSYERLSENIPDTSEQNVSSSLDYNSEFHGLVLSTTDSFDPVAYKTIYKLQILNNGQIPETSKLKYKTTQILDGETANLISDVFTTGDLTTVSLTASQGTITNLTASNANISSATISAAGVMTISAGVGNITSATIDTASVGVCNADVANINTASISTLSVSNINVTTNNLTASVGTTTATTYPSLVINNSNKVVSRDLSHSTTISNGDIIRIISQDKGGKVQVTTSTISLTSNSQGNMTVEGVSVTLSELGPTGKPTFSELNVTSKTTLSGTTILSGTLSGGSLSGCTLSGGTISTTYGTISVANIMTNATLGLSVDQGTLVLSLNLTKGKN